jgi:hypothetical protein
VEAGAAGTEKVGRGVEVGTTNFGAAAGGGLGGFGNGAFTVGGAAEAALVSSGGTATAGGATAEVGPWCLLMMAFRASPGLEI